VAYALIADLGLPLISVGTRTPQGYQLAVGLIAAHAISLAVCALGLTALETHVRDVPRAAGLRGVGRRAPLAAAAAVAGLLSLSGFPLTAGFPARWALLQSLAASDLLSALGIVAGIAIGAAAALRWLGVLLEEGQEAPVPLPIGDRAFLAGGVFFCVLFGTFPQLFAGVFGIAQGFPNLIP
jgi:formate hydrogenlyase subunit 3/multisubunit Na+/H+ antiporter MnhD subunit